MQWQLEVQASVRAVVHLLVIATVASSCCCKPSFKRTAEPTSAPPVLVRLGSGELSGLLGVCRTTGRGTECFTPTLKGSKGGHHVVDASQLDMQLVPTRNVPADYTSAQDPAPLTKPCFSSAACSVFFEDPIDHVFLDAGPTVIRVVIGTYGNRQGWEEIHVYQVSDAAATTISHELRGFDLEPFADF